MRLKLDIDLCKKLLAVFTKHDRTSCTDQDRINQYANSAGWVSCTRCWLLQAVDENWIPEGVEFELYSSIRIVQKDTAILLSEYTVLINRFGIDHPKANNFLQANKDDKEFCELAKLAQNLKRKIDNGC